MLKDDSFAPFLIVGRRRLVAAPCVVVPSILGVVSRLLVLLHDDLFDLSEEWLFFSSIELSTLRAFGFRFSGKVR